MHENAYILNSTMQLYRNLFSLHTHVKLYTVSQQKHSKLFYQHFVKSPPNLIIFGTTIAKTIELCKMHSFLPQFMSSH